MAYWVIVKLADEVATVHVDRAQRRGVPIEEHLQEILQRDAGQDACDICGRTGADVMLGLCDRCAELGEELQKDIARRLSR